LARTVPVPVASQAGEIFSGAWRVEAGSRQDARGVLETRAELEKLREQVRDLAADVKRLTSALSTCDAAITSAEARVAATISEEHESEKAIVGLDADVRRATDDSDRLTRRLEVVTTDRQRAGEEERGAGARREARLAPIP